MRTLYSHSWLRLPAAGMVAIAIFAAGIIGVMNWSRTQPQAAAAA